MATVLVTGATSGLGEALTLKLAKEGHEVIACGRNKDKLITLDHLDLVTTVSFDVTNIDATHEALKNISADYYVLNAGTCEYIDINDVEADMFKRVFEANVLGASNVMSAVLPNCRAGNTLVFVDSLARLLPFPRSEAYGASKAALYYMAKSFAVDLHKLGIHVKTMSPGFVKTPLTDKNDFPMPMQITAEDAAEYMYKGLFSRSSTVYFPRRFSFIIRALHALPDFIQHKLCVGMARNVSRHAK